MIRLFLLFILVLFSISFSSGVVLGGGLEEDIKGMLAEIIAEGDIEKAEQKGDLARQILSSRSRTVDVLAGSFLEADIKQAMAKRYIAEMKTDPENAEWPRQADLMLQWCVGAYDQLAEYAGKASDDISRRLKDEDIQSNSRWRQVRGYISRAKYSLAWCYYYLGVIAGDRKIKGDYYDRSIGLFNAFTRGGYKNNSIITDCFIGKALCLIDIGDHYAASRLLEEVKGAETGDSKAFFKRIMFLRIQSYAAIGANVDVVILARQYFRTLADDHTLDSVDIEIAVMRLKSLVILSRENRRNPYYKSFRKQFDKVCRQAFAYGGQLAAKTAQVLEDHGIVTAASTVNQAGRYYSEGRYRDSLAKIDEGLALAAIKDDREQFADLEYLRIACFAKLGRLDKAFAYARDFTRQHIDDDRFADAAQIAFQTAGDYRDNIDAAARLPFDKEMMEYFDYIAENIDKKQAATVELAKAAFLLEKEWALQAGKVLDRIDTEMLEGGRFYEYLYVRFMTDIKAAAEKDSPGMTKDLPEKAILYLNRYAQARKSGIEKWQMYCMPMLQAALMAAGEVMANETAAADRILKVVDALERLECAGDDFEVRLLALRIEVYALNEDLPGISALLKEIINTETGREEIIAPAIANVGRVLETKHSQITESSDSDQMAAAKEIGRKLYKLYDFLYGYLKSNSEKDFREHAGQIHRKLAQSMLLTGRFEEAVGVYGRLTADESGQSDGELMTGLARALQAAGSFDQAGDVWGRLAGGLKKETPMWFESNYRWIECYLLAGKVDQAGKIKDYYLLKYENILPAHWQEKFKDLGKEKGL